MPDNQPQREFARQVVTTLRDAGHESLWAGGCVRDELLGRVPKDYDVATSARPEQVRELFGRRRTLAIGASFGVISVLGGKGLDPIEVATFRSDGAYVDGRHPTEVTFTSAEEDAQRRDFTINGLFFDPLQDRLIDYVGGEQDLQAEVIRAIGDPTARFTEDKLRMLRAVRFATTFGFAIEPATQAAIQTMADQVSVVSAERIGMELRKILLHQNRSRGVQLLQKLGILKHVVSYLPPLTNDDVLDEVRFQRTLDVLDRLVEPSLPLALAALLLEVHSAVAAHNVARELRYTKKEEALAGWLSLTVGMVGAANQYPWPEIQRVLIHPNAAELVAFYEAVTGQEDEGSAFCREKLQLPTDELNPPLLVSGDDLVAHGLKPGKHFGQLLDHIRDAQLEGRISDQQQALQLADEWIIAQQIE